MSDNRPNEAKVDELKARAEETKQDFRQATQETRRDLEAQVSKLREDVAGVAESLRSLASGGASTARAQAFALRDDVRETGERYFRQAQEAAGDLEAEISDRVRAEPIKAVLIAAAVGYFYARVFRN